MLCSIPICVPRFLCAEYPADRVCVPRFRRVYQNNSTAPPPPIPQRPRWAPPTPTVVRATNCDAWSICGIDRSIRFAAISLVDGCVWGWFWLVDFCWMLLLIDGFEGEFYWSSFHLAVWWYWLHVLAVCRCFFVFEPSPIRKFCDFGASKLIDRFDPLNQFVADFCWSFLKGSGCIFWSFTPIVFFGKDSGVAVLDHMKIVQPPPPTPEKTVGRLACCPECLLIKSICAWLCCVRSSNHIAMQMSFFGFLRPSEHSLRDFLASTSFWGS